VVVKPEHVLLALLDGVIDCVIGCMTGHVKGCVTDCVADIATDCVVGCTTDCVVGCATDCVVGCATDCVVDFATGCMIAGCSNGTDGSSLLVAMASWFTGNNPVTRNPPLLRYSVLNEHSQSPKFGN